MLIGLMADSHDRVPAVRELLERISERGAAKGVGIELHESPHSFEVGGRRILLVHDLGEVAERSLESHEIIVHGFTHRQEIRELAGGAIIVNPGEACGWLHGVPAAAVLDLETKVVEFISL